MFTPFVHIVGEGDMRRLCAVLCLTSMLLLFTGGFGWAQAQPVVPADHEEFLSGGATDPDLTDTLAGPTSPTGTGRPPRVGANTLVNAPQQAFPNGLLGRSETTIAAATDGVSLLAGFNDAQGFCGAPFGGRCTPESPPGLSGFAFSTNGGLTWTDGGAPNPALFNNVFTRGDPWMDRGGFDNATFYYANLAVDTTTGATLGVSVHRGHFNSSGFAFEDVRTFNSPNPNDFYDKEAIAAAKDLSGTAYVTLTNFKEECGVPASGFGEITVWRTTDGGASWQGPVVAGPDLSDLTTCGTQGPTNGVLQQSSVPTIGPNGELYVSWQMGPTFTGTSISTDAKIVVATSLDGGVTFGAPVVVASINSMRQDPPVGYNRGRLNDHPRIMAATSGTKKGRVYVVFYSAVSPVGPAPVVTCPSGLPSTAICIGQNLVSSQVFVSFSDNKGVTWSSPTAIAPVVPVTGLKRWWPVVSVEPSGNVDVVYYESQEVPTASNPECIVRIGGVVRRAGTANSLVNMFWVQSLDAGSTFQAPLQVSTATSNWCTTVSNIRPNFGDYIGSFNGGNQVFPVWADGRNGVPDTFFAAILAGKSNSTGLRITTR